LLTILLLVLLLLVWQKMSQRLASCLFVTERRRTRSGAPAQEGGREGGREGGGEAGEDGWRKGWREERMQGGRQRRKRRRQAQHAYTSKDPLPDHGQQSQ
jgi:hypothetical protein